MTKTKNRRYALVLHSNGSMTPWRAPSDENELDRWLRGQVGVIIDVADALGYPGCTLIYDADRSYDPYNSQASAVHPDTETCIFGDAVLLGPKPEDAGKYGMEGGNFFRIVEDFTYFEIPRTRFPGKEEAHDKEEG